MKKDKIKLYNWEFKKDPVNFYSFSTNVFSKEECEKIIKISKESKLFKGTTLRKSNIRNSNITWLYPGDNMEWVFDKATNVILNLNEKFFKFDLTGIMEGFQFTEYKSPSGKHGKHVDRITGMQIRKLSIVIQLTNPNEYEGGELKLYDGIDEEAVIMNKEQGTLIAFPSYVMHQVTPLTKGKRNSLVTWVTGNPFK
jgi:PKHD-type hydroxylase